MAENATQIHSNVGEGQGQAQADGTGFNPHDGKHPVDETHIVSDRQILDANSELAVQVPEGVGASTVGHPAPLRAAYEAGTPESQFEAAAKEDKKSK